MNTKINIQKDIRESEHEYNERIANQIGGSFLEKYEDVEHSDEEISKLEDKVSEKRKEIEKLQKELKDFSEYFTVDSKFFEYDLHSESNVKYVRTESSYGKPKELDYSRDIREHDFQYNERIVDTVGGDLQRRFRQYEHAHDKKIELENEYSRLNHISNLIRHEIERFHHIEESRGCQERVDELYYDGDKCRIEGCSGVYEDVENDHCQTPGYSEPPCEFWELCCNECGDNIVVG